jgi:hypothetical protein
MEIGEHRRNHFEFESGINEEVRSGRPRGNPTCAEQCRVFESSNRSSAYADYSARIAKSLVDGKSSLSRDRIGFGMDFVILDAIDADGLKCSKAYVQSDLDSFDSALADSIEDFGGEVKTSCRSRHRAALLGIHSLITLPIRQGILAFDIRGQWDVPDAIEDRKEIHPIRQRLKTDAPLAELPTGNDMGFQFIRVAEKQSFSDADFTPGPNQALPLIGLGGKLARQQNLDSAAKVITGRRIALANRLSTDACPAPVKPRWKDSSVVEDHKIARPQQIRKVAEVAISILATTPVQMEHARAGAVGKGLLGNEFGGKMKLEVGNQHGVRL